MTSAERIAYLHEEAMKLTDDERRDFVRSLAASLDDDIDVVPEARAEIERRIEAIDAGTTTGLSPAEAMAQVRSRLGW